MPRIRTKPKPSLPLWFWAFGIAVIAFGLWLSWPSDYRSSTSTTLGSIQQTSDLSDESVFTDYFDAGWRSGDVQQQILVEATYFFPELHSALEAIPVKSGHQGEVADRLAVLKPSTETLVFYLTFATPDESVQSLVPEELVKLSDDKGNSYPVQQWSEANALLLPASEVRQRIGLLAFSQTDTQGQSFTANAPTKLQLEISLPDQPVQTLNWDLALLDTFLHDYAR